MKRGSGRVAVPSLSFAWLHAAGRCQNNRVPPQIPASPASARQIVVQPISFECADSRHSLSQNEVNVVGAFVRVSTRGFAKCRTRIFGRNSIRAAAKRRVSAPASVVMLIAVSSALGAAIPAAGLPCPPSLRRLRWSGKELPLHQLGQHLRQSLLLQLEPAMGFPRTSLIARVQASKLNMRQLLAPIAPQAIPCVSRPRQHIGVFLIPPDLKATTALSRGSRTSCSTSSLVSEARSDSFPFWSFAVNPGVSVGTIPGIRDRLVALVVAGLRPYDRHLCRRSIRDPHLRAVDDPASILRARVIIPRRIGPIICLGEAKASDHFAPVPFLGDNGASAASLPKAKIGYITSAPCTDANERTPNRRAPAPA